MGMDAAALSNMLEGMVPFIKKVGVKVTHFRSEENTTREATCVLPADPTNMNHVGIFHAGATYTLAETAGGAIVMACFDIMKYRLAIRKAEITYKKPGSTDLTCAVTVSAEDVKKAEAEIEAKGRLDFTVPMTIVDTQGVVIAEVVAVYNLKKN